MRTASISRSCVQRLVAQVEADVEQLHHPRLDDVGELAGDHHQGFLLRHDLPEHRRRMGLRPQGCAAQVQAAARLDRDHPALLIIGRPEM